MRLVKSAEKQAKEAVEREAAKSSVPAVPASSAYEPATSPKLANDPANRSGSLSGPAVRDNLATKLPTHLVPYELILAAAIGLEHGARKYSAHNYQKGLPLSSLYGSVERHLRAMMAGEVTDDDSGLPHYALLASSVAMLMHNIMTGRAIDDIEPSMRTVSAAAGLVHLSISDMSTTARAILDVGTRHE